MSTSKKKGAFFGWNNVLSFTLRQQISAGKFKLVTVIVAIIALVGLSAINIIVSLVGDDKKAELTMKEVIVCDETGIINDNFDTFSTMYEEEAKDIKLTLDNSDLKTIEEKYLEEKDSVIIHTYEDKFEDKKVYKLEMLIPDKSNVSKDSGDEFLDMFEGYFSNMKLVNSGIDMEKLVTILTPVNATVSQTGEDADTMGEELVKIGVPMIFVLLMYMMLLMYGQSISKCVISEKSSKLMETMLTTVRPYAIITGKVLGMACVAIGQMTLWVVMGVAGFLIGDKIAAAVTPGYKNIVLEVINLVREDAGNAFTPYSVIMFLVAMCMGFVLYCILAALVSAGAKRAEELNNSLAIYNLIVVGGFLLTYMLPLKNGSFADKVDLIPPLAVFKLPTDILLGQISIANTLVSLVLMVITMFVLVIFTGKIYKKKIF